MLCRSHLVHLILGFHVASKVIGQQEPIIALGHVINVVHKVLEVLSMAKGAISDPAGMHMVLHKVFWGQQGSKQFICPTCTARICKDIPDDGEQTRVQQNQL